MVDRYCDRRIGLEEGPLWGSALRDTGSFPTVILEPNSTYTIELPIVSSDVYRNQMAQESFTDFDNPEIAELTGYPGEIMRANGCGITAEWMVLSTLNPQFPQNLSLGRLAIEAVALHRNDAEMPDGSRKKGRPVFTPDTGWYHDALCYIAREFGGVDAFRVQDIKEQPELMRVVCNLAAEGKKCMVIASVRNKYWRSYENENQGTHLVILNGFEVDAENNVTRVRVVDSYPEPDPFTSEPKLNTWVDMDDRRIQAFTGKYIIFST